MSFLCFHDLSLGSLMQLPKYCFIGAFELHRRYRKPPLVLQLMFPSMAISCPVLNSVTVRITSSGLDVMTEQYMQAILSKPLGSRPGVDRRKLGLAQQIFDVFPPV